MQPYKEHPTAEYRSYLDLPKRQYFADLKKYPEPESLRSTFGWFEVRRMPGGTREDGDLSYGEEGEIRQVFGDGFSVMYV